MTINLNQLRSFYMAAKYKSITIAAKKLYVSPPAVSMQISKLEHWLDFKLLIRERNVVGLTKEGRDIFKKADAIFNEVQKLENDIDDMVQTRKYEVSIGAHHISGKYIIPGMIDHFQKICPNLIFKLVIGNKNVLLKKLLGNEIQLALIIGKSKFDQIKTIRLFSEQLVLVCAMNSKHIQEKEISYKKIKRLPLFIQEKGTGMAEAIHEYFNQVSISPDIVMDNLSSDIIRQFIIQDDGVAFIPKFAAQEAIAKGKLKSIKIKEGLPEAIFNLAFLEKKKNLSQQFRKLVLSVENKEFIPLI